MDLKKALIIRILMQTFIYFFIFKSYRYPMLKVHDAVERRGKHPSL